MVVAELWAKEPLSEAYAARSQHVWMDVESELRSFARCDLVESFRPLDALVIFPRFASRWVKRDSKSLRADGRQSVTNFHPPQRGLPSGIGDGEGLHQSARRINE